MRQTLFETGKKELKEMNNIVLLDDEKEGVPEGIPAPSEDCDRFEYVSEKVDCFEREVRDLKEKVHGLFPSKKKLFTRLISSTQIGRKILSQKMLFTEEKQKKVKEYLEQIGNLKSEVQSWWDDITEVVYPGDAHSKRILDVQSDID